MISEMYNLIILTRTIILSKMTGAQESVKNPTTVLLYKMSETYFCLISRRGLR